MQRAIYSILISMFALSAHADTMTKISEDVLSTRKTLVKQYEHTAPIEIAFSPANVEKTDIFYWANRYLPLANVLTNETHRLVRLIPESNPNVLGNAIKQQKYNWLFIRPDMAVVAQEFGYTPIARLQSDYEPVFVARKGIYKSLDDVKGSTEKPINIGMSYTSTESPIAMAFLKAKKLDNPTTTQMYDAGIAGYPHLWSKLVNTTLDVVVINKYTAQNWINSNPGKAQIIGTAGSIPEMIVLAKSDISEKDIRTMESTLLKLNASDNVIKDAVQRANFNIQSGLIFVPYTRDFLRELRDAMVVNNSSYGKNIYDPVSDSQLELAKFMSADLRKNSK